MTYIRSVPSPTSTKEAVGIHVHNAREWVEDARQQGFRNPAPIAFAIEEIIKATEWLAEEVRKP
jgi:hypothetical protein